MNYKKLIKVIDEQLDPNLQDIVNRASKLSRSYWFSMDYSKYGDGLEFHFRPDENSNEDYIEHSANMLMRYAWDYGYDSDVENSGKETIIHIMPMKKKGRRR